METQNVGQPSDPELFGRGLFRFANVAVKPFRICQFLRLYKLLQTIVDMTVLVSVLLFLFTDWTWINQFFTSFY